MPATTPRETRGLLRLDLATGRDGVIFVPSTYRSDKPAPLVVLLHGAGANGDGIIGVLKEEAERTGTIILAPDSRGATWDVLGGGFGPDVRYLDQALRQTFSQYAIDPSRIAIGGFSDGASYALSLGQANGDLFGAILAFSPGFSAPPEQVGSPKIFVSHGKADQVLPIDRCSRRIVPRLEQRGVEVHYIEFTGGHSVPERIARQAMSWWLSPPTSPSSETTRSQ